MPRARPGRSSGRGGRSSAPSTSRCCCAARDRAGWPWARTSRSAFRIVRDELGVEVVRAHAILHDVLGVYREDADGTPRYDFDEVDLVIDRLLATGLRPVVELSFMPKALAADPEPSVFDYIGLISPPRDLDRWADLVEALVRHLVARHGLDEVVRWGFEVWNEAEHQGLLGRPPERLLRPVRRDRPGREGGRRAVARSAGRRPRPPAGSTTCSTTPPRPACPVDFVTTHTYGAPPLDLRPILERYGRTGHPDLVDRMGRQPDPRRAGERQRLGRPARRARHALGGRSRRRAGLLGRLGPVRGARRARAALPRRVRPAHDRRAAQAAVLGHRGPRAAGRARSWPAGSPGTAAAASSRRGRAGTRTGTGIASRSRSGTARSIRRRPPATTASAAT